MGLHLAFLFIYLGLSSVFPAEVLSAVLIGHSAISIIIDLRKKKKLYVMTAFYIGVILTTLANLLYIIKVGAGGVTEFSMYRYIVPEHIAEATSIWCVGNSCIFIGYALFERNSLPPVSFDLKSPKVLKNMYTFIVVFAILNLTGNMINLGAITGGIQKVLSLLNVMGILFYARLWVHENNVKYRNYAITLAVLQTIIALYTSYLRIELLTPAISFFGGYFIGKGSIKYVFSPRIIPALIFAGIFSLFFNTLAGNRAHFIDAFKSNNGREQSSGVVDLSEGEDKGEGGALERSANIAQLTNIVELVKKNGHYGGLVSYPLVAAFIPRFLWPDKPQVQLGVWFALEIGAATVGEGGRANNSVNMSVPGQLFLDFGWIGVTIGCVLFGALIALFWNASEFNGSPYNLSGALWGGYLLLYALLGIGSDLQIVVSLISTYLVFMIIKKVAQRKNENTGRRPAMAGQ